jgi:8-oxo-dGTP pyrophosphatase MutT (NUDIX family)
MRQVDDVPELRWRRAAAYVVCRDERERILLTRFSADGHPDSGKWTMPGGAMEWGETPEETALREMEEETGLRARLGAILGVFSLWLTATESVLGHPGHVIGVVFEGTDLSGELRTSFEPGTTDAAAWFTRDEVLSLPHVGLVDFVLARLR